MKISFKLPEGFITFNIKLKNDTLVQNMTGNFFVKLTRYHASLLLKGFNIPVIFLMSLPDRMEMPDFACKKKDHCCKAIHKFSYEQYPVQFFRRQVFI